MNAGAEAETGVWSVLSRQGDKTAETGSQGVKLGVRFGVTFDLCLGREQKMPRCMIDLRCKGASQDQMSVPTVNCG